MSIDDAFVEHLVKEGYHPRSSKHSDFLSEIIIADLLENCPAMAEKAARGELVVKLRHHQQVGYDDWVIDIAFGTCAGKPQLPPEGQAITFTAPAIIQVAIELKTVMTEHGKAQRNRLRDFAAFASHGHRYEPATVLGAVLAVNAAGHFYSPLRNADDITVHGTKKASAREVARTTVDLFRSMALRHSDSRSQGLDGLGVIAVEHDNLAIHPDPAAYAHMHKPTRVAPVPPSPSVGDPMHYHAMIQRLCTAYTRRFG
ncbi:MAG: hypothetical protein ACE5OQ_17110 [Woeseia sp.]